MYTVREAIANLKGEIRDKQAQIKQLEKFDNISAKGLTEKTYHEFCETDLRCSDTLGESLLTVFPFLVYKKRGTNYFFYYPYEFSDILVRIPNSRCDGVELVVSKYFYDKELAEKLINQEYMLRESSLKRDIEKYSTYLDTNNPFKRAKLLFPSDRLLFAVLKLLGLGKQASTPIIKAKCKEKIERQSQLYLAKEGRIADAIENYDNQQEKLQKLAKEFLKWTDNVRVYQGETTQYVTATYRMDGKELIIKRG